jgi:hypothetical protein
VILDLCRKFIFSHTAAPSVAEIITNEIAAISLHGIKTLSETQLPSDHPLLAIDIPVINGKLGMLYCKDFYRYLELLNLKRPYEKFINQHKHSRGSVLVGVSGAGKTATCVAVARELNCVYIDCFADADFLQFCQIIEEVALYENDGMKLKQLTVNWLQIFIFTRWSLLGRLLKLKLSSEDHRLVPWKLFSYQRSPEFQSTVTKLLKNLPRDSRRLGVIDFKPELHKVILDEAQILFGFMSNRYPDSSNNPNCRSLFSAIVGGLYRSMIPFILCGTQMSMKDHSLVVSAAGGGKGDESIPVFTDFTYYDPAAIRRILEWSFKPGIFAQIHQNNPELVDYACFVLQGRARFLAAFLLRLHVDFTLATVDYAAYFRQVLLEYVQTCTELPIPRYGISNDQGIKSLGRFWQVNFNKSISIYASGSQQNQFTIGSLLVDMALDYLQMKPNHRYLGLDLVDTALVRLHRDGFDKFSYTMAEPLAIQAGLNFMSSIIPHPFMERFAWQIFNTSSGETAQSIGKLMELVVAIRCTQSWWSDVDKQSEDVKLLFPDWALDRFKSLPAPHFIVNQSKAKENGRDWVLSNYTDPVSDVFVLPDDRFGPDGIYQFMCFHLKTTQSAYVSGAECKSNFSKTDFRNWCTDSSNDRKAAIIKAATKESRWPGLIHFLIELPQSNPEDNRALVKSDQQTVIRVNLNSPLARLIIGDLIVDCWLRSMLR